MVDKTISSRKFYLKIPEVEGFDTETNKGLIVVLASSISSMELNKEKWKKGIIEYNTDILTWLYENAKDYNFFFNIRFDLSVILRPYITKENKDSIRSGKDIRLGKFTVNYISNKFFSIAITNSKGYEPKRFFDIAQFYSIVKDDNKLNEFDRKSTLEALSQLFLNTGKIDKELGLDRKKMGNDKEYFIKNFDTIKKYCINDSYLTKRLGELLRDSLFETVKVYPKFLNSKASISKAYLSKFHREQSYAYWKLLAKYEDYPLINNYIFQTYKGGIFTLYSLGLIENSKEIDINSAYPDAIIKLKDIINSKIEFVKKYTKADYGFYKCKIKFSKEYPVPFKQKIGKNSYRVLYPISLDYYEIYITAIEYEFLYSNGIDIKVIDGFIVKTKGIESFKDYQTVYDLKNTNKKKYKESDNIKYLIISDRYKIIMNATYGCFAESKESLTEWTNFIYSSYITASTRITIWKALKDIYSHNCKPKAIMTDAIVYKGDYDFPDSEKLGEFKAEANGTFTFFMNGIMIYNEMVEAKRGFPNLNYKMLTNAEGHKLEIIRNKPLGLKEGIIQNKKEDIGNFLDIRKEIELYSNMEKYVINQDELTFENLNKNEVETMPILLSDEVQYFKILPESDLEKFIKIGKIYNRTEFLNSKNAKLDK